MPLVNGDGGNETIASIISETVESVRLLVKAHLRLARLEVSSELKILSRRFALYLIAASFLSLGYGFLCLGIVMFASQWFGLGYTSLVTGGLHLVLGVSIYLATKPKVKHSQRTQSDIVDTGGKNDSFDSDMTSSQKSIQLSSNDANSDTRAIANTPIGAPRIA
jgi:Putative Actinobacterial Holin-X, holin superfamily III